MHARPAAPRRGRTLSPPPPPQDDAALAYYNEEAKDNSDDFIGIVFHDCQTTMEEDQEFQLPNTMTDDEIARLGILVSEIRSASGTTPSEEEQGDEDLDAERSVQGEEDVRQEGEEVQGKAIWIHGSASLPDAPRTKYDKLLVYVEKPEALGLVATVGR
ncbi:hypothetical protein ACQ4PT_070952 [Festuca glaucescens]